MPTTTFFNLPKEKQDIILKAARSEFTRVPFTEASINQIIQVANISRGSFYMYFQDKEDLYQYLLQTYSKRLEKRYIDILEKHHGDIVDTYLDLFQMVVKKIDAGKQKDFFKRMVMNVTFKNDNLFDRKTENRVLAGAFKKIDRTHLNIATEQELYDMMDCIHMLFIHALMRVLKRKLTEQEAYDTFARQLRILKEGLYKEEKYD